MVGMKIDFGIGVDIGVVGDVLFQIVVFIVVDIEVCVVVVIVQLQGVVVFCYLFSGFFGIGVFQIYVGKQVVGQ